MGAAGAFAQSAVPGIGIINDGGVVGFLLSLAQNHPWVATVLLVIGALRVVFKPVMSLMDGFVKANCSPEEYGRLQSFEAGPIYKWVNFALDLVGSIKLPVVGVKPSKSTTSPAE